MTDNLSDETENTKLIARELPSAVNSQVLLDEHLNVTKNKVRTRFPPEPNGTVVLNQFNYFLIFVTIFINIIYVSLEINRIFAYWTCEVHEYEL